jgi:hypothetical protein
MSNALTLVLVALHVLEAAPAASTSVTALSPKLRAALTAEMVAVNEGTMAITRALPIGDWEAVALAADRIRGAYVLENALNAQEKEELERLLPEDFRRRDAEAHGRAALLAAAARAHDGEVATFHFQRLLDSCLGCHVEHATARFPHLARPSAGKPEHPR